MDDVTLAITVFLATLTVLCFVLMSVLLYLIQNKTSGMSDGLDDMSDELHDINKGFIEFKTYIPNLIRGLPGARARSTKAATRRTLKEELPGGMRIMSALGMEDVATDYPQLAIFGEKFAQGLIGQVNSVVEPLQGKVEQLISSIGEGALKAGAETVSDIAKEKSI